MSGPSFYGEVLPLSSRAVDEEEDEEDYETSTFRCVTFNNPLACHCWCSSCQCGMWLYSSAIVFFVKHSESLAYVVQCGCMAHL